MCRLLYLKSKDKIDTKEYLQKFALICKNSKEYQGHGWGVSFYHNSKWKHYKNIKPIWEDDFSQFENSSRFIVHARSAFQDKDIIVENNMPFHDDNYVFVFNGELSGVKIKEDGRIGAEKIFNFIKRFDSGSIEQAVSKGIDILKKRTTYVRAINLIIADNKSAYVSSNFSEDEDYFTMHYYKDDSRLIICSEPFDGETNWQKINNNSLGKFE